MIATDVLKLTRKKKVAIWSLRKKENLLLIYSEVVTIWKKKSNALEFQQN